MQPLLTARVAAVPGAVLATARAAAEHGAEPVKLEYAVPAGCPGEVTFRTQVLARTTRVEFVPEAPTVFRVEVGAGAGTTGYAGTLFIVQRGETTAEKLPRRRHPQCHGHPQYQSRLQCQVIRGATVIGSAAVIRGAAVIRTAVIRGAAVLHGAVGRNVRWPVRSS